MSLAKTACPRHLVCTPYQLYKVTSCFIVLFQHDVIILRFVLVFRNFCTILIQTGIAFPIHSVSKIVCRRLCTNACPRAQQGLVNLICTFRLEYLVNHRITDTVGVDWCFERETGRVFYNDLSQHQSLCISHIGILNRNKRIRVDALEFQRHAFSHSAFFQELVCHHERCISLKHACNGRSGIQFLGAFLELQLLLCWKCGLKRLARLALDERSYDKVVTFYQVSLVLPAVAGIVEPIVRVHKIHHGIVVDCIVMHGVQDTFAGIIGRYVHQVNA